MLKPIETARLLLRPLEKTDAERLFLLDSNPEVMKYIGQPVLSEIEQSQEVIAMIQKQYHDNGIGRYAVIEKESGLLIGWSGLKLYKGKINNHENFYELGYRFLPEFWGKGYAKESSRAFLEAGFNEINIDVIYAYTHCENTASNNALEKLGFQKTGEFEEPDGICFWYELTKNEFLTIKK